MKSYNEIKEILLRDYPKYFDILDLDSQIRGLFGVDQENYKKQLDRNLDNYMDCSKRVADNKGLRDHDWLEQNYKRLLNIYNDIKNTYKEADSMNLYKSIKSNLKEADEEVKVKVTFECPECGKMFDKKFTFDSEEEAEEVFDSDADVDCPKCGGRAYPEGMEYIGKKKIKEAAKVGPIYRIGQEEYITSYNDIKLDEIGITLEDIELFKRVDTSESAPDKVNYLLVADMRWDLEPSMSIPIVYNITDEDYEEEINPPMLGIYDEDLDSQVYHSVDEVIRTIALRISESGRLTESEKKVEKVDKICPICGDGNRYVKNIKGKRYYACPLCGYDEPEENIYK